MKLSIVTTLFKSAPYIDEFYRRAVAAAQQITDAFEIIFVNDGSPDESLEKAIKLYEADPRVVVVDLSRNFGHHKAMMTGLEHASGELIFLIDSDLEEAPEWLLDFHRDIVEKNVDVVFGQQQKRKGGWFERWSGEIYYSALNILGNVEHPRNIVTTRLMSRRYVDSLLSHRERELVISYLWVITGFKQHARPVQKGTKSASTYSLARRIGLGVMTISSFSDMPLKLAFYTGFFILCGAVVYTAYLLVLRIFLSQMLDGWTSVMASIWMLGGLIIFFIGLIGLYLAKIFNEVKQRPYTIVRGIYGQSKSGHQR
nr:glycosyltransferase family 2 protein [uncultured Dongia sp.]